jgi:hypothetical protein
MAYLIRGHIARGRGDWAAAESHFSEALKYNQGIPDLYLVLIEAQLMGGNWRDASATMRRLNHRYPEEMNSEFGQSLVERYNTTRKKEQRAKVRRALAAKKAARAAEDK